ncbi:hypothetical protein KZZ52_49880 [Dactylosporangium sp. AC04546]|uniref:hypothetical protein n=1 Tax=Dactylosporangium sp. AC04546 TaxID=2862460 RepID=UPI001EE0313E|nr:hypothetical protein [Dactylosporangium sp. AC04546]WVK81996.1 hypothetical protein KZZ52_49880 [Dactylosporangium sp. AC04546]
MILLNRVDRWFVLERPVFVAPGQTYWIDRDADVLCIDRGDGRIERVPGFMCR